MSPDGLIWRFNSHAERMFGYAADEAAGQPLKMLMPERFREPHEKGFRRYLETGEAHVIGNTVELAGLRKSGEEFPLELSLGEVRHGESRSFVGILQDITDRKEAERQLRESEQRNASLSEHNPDGVFTVDLEANLLTVNPAMQVDHRLQPGRASGDESHAPRRPERRRAADGVFRESGPR